MALLTYKIAVALVLLVAVAGADEQIEQEDSVKRDVKALQGTWQIDEKETSFFWTGWIDSQCFPNFDKFVGSETIEIKGDKIRYGEKREHEITFVLGKQGTKSTIHFRNGENDPVIGIYELDKEVLRICAVDPGLGGGKEKVRLPEKCGRSRVGWFVQYQKAKP